MLSARTLTLATLLASTLAPLGAWAANPKCYFPNGSLTSSSTNLTYEACNTIAGATSQCCATSQGCSANGLCVSTTGQHSRGGCTDPTFKSPFCLSTCSSLLTGGSPSASADVHQCSDGTWCCGSNNTNATATCCATGQGITIPITIGMDKGDSASMTNTVKVSIGAGVAAAILVSLGVVGFVTWRRRQQRQRELQERLAILSPTRSDHGLLPFFESEGRNGEKVARPKAARLSG